jgi:hypothetical protein
VLGKLKQGSVMLLQGVAVRDVTKTTVSHKHFVVTTTPAAITDLVSNGTISLRHSINFAKGFGVGGTAVPDAQTAHLRRAQSSSELSKFGLVPLAGSKGITFKGKTHSYKYSVNFKPSGSSVAVTITISRDTPIDLEAKITGTLDNLSTGGDIAVDKGSVAGAKMLANHLKGNFKLSYTAKPLTAFGIPDDNPPVVISLPAEIAVPFAVGPVPFFVGIGVGFTVSAGFSNLHQELSGSYTFKYDGEGGFSMDQSGATTSDGVLKGLGDIILSAVNALKTGPINFVFGAQMPQIELGLGVKGLDVAGKVTVLGVSGISNQGSCDTRQFEIQGDAGAEADFFGFSADLASAQLFDKKIEASYPKGCGTFP